MLKRLVFICLSIALLSALVGFNVPNVSNRTAVRAGTDLLKAATLTDAEVQSMGRETIQALDKKNTIAGSDNTYAQRLNTIVSGLTSVDGKQLNYQVYLSSKVNAFAVADGSIRVYSGLMDLMDDDELYFVIGHEIGHVVHGHSADAYRVAYAASAARKGARAAGGTAAALSRSELGKLGEELINSQFSQSQETESDEYGLSLMQRNGKDTAAAVSALRKLASLGGSSSMFSSHPDSNARANRIESMRNQ